VKVIKGNFCDGLEMAFTSPLSGIHIQQGGAPKAAAKSATLFFTLGW